MEADQMNAAERVQSSPWPPTISQHGSSRAARERTNQPSGTSGTGWRALCVPALHYPNSEQKSASGVCPFASERVWRGEMCLLTQGKKDSRKEFYSRWNLTVWTDSTPPFLIKDLVNQRDMLPIVTSLYGFTLDHSVELGSYWLDLEIKVTLCLLT